MKNKVKNPVADYILKKLSKDSVAYQAVLQEIPLSLSFLRKCISNGLSIIRSGKKSFYPIALCIESSAKCNLSCTMCPRTDLLTRSKGNMDFGLYKKIVDAVNPVFLTLAQFGEPLLHPKILEMVSYARKKKMVVRITTNATLLTSGLSQGLIDAQLSHLLISFDSCTKSLLEKLRYGTNFEKVVTNIKKLIELKRKKGSVYPIVGFNMTLSQDNMHEITDMIKFCLREFGTTPTFTRMYTYGEAKRTDSCLTRADAEYLKEAYDYANSLSLNSVCENLNTIFADIADPVSGDRPCFFPYYTTSVTWDGKVYPCCIYFDGQVIFGDLSKEPFGKVWNSHSYQEFRKNLKGDREGMPLCKTCPLIDIGINNAIARYRPVSLLAGAIRGRSLKYISRKSHI